MVLDSVSLRSPNSYCCFVDVKCWPGKETWEPVLTELAQLDAESSLVKEAWAIDCPNSGESALLNEKLLFKDSRDVSK